MAQVVLSMLKPVGMVGEIVQAVGMPPAMVGVRGVILAVLSRMVAAVP